MEDRILSRIAEETGINKKQVENTVKLLDADNTVPFIARYRKEVTGGLNEVEIRKIAELVKLYRNLEVRKQEVIRLISEQGKLTPELEDKIVNAPNVTALEDVYRPFRPKKRTRAMIARERGLEGLARFMIEGQGRVEEEAEKYLSTEVKAVSDALKGAMDIIAEEIADDAGIRVWVRNFIRRTGVIVCKAEDPEKESVYQMYYDYREPVSKMPPHRILAINRGEREEYIKVDIEVEREKIYEHIALYFKVFNPEVEDYIKKAVEDAYKRLIEPSVIREIRNELTERAEAHAVEIFAANLRNLLLTPPVKNKIVLGVKNSGLVHISELSSAYVKHPLEIVAVGQIVEVEVLSVDVAKGRIALTMKF